MSALDELEIAAIRGGVDERVLNRARAERNALRSAASERDAEVERAAVELVDKIEKIHASVEYRAVWECAQIHRGQYRGESYENELNTLKDALAAIRARGEKV